MPYEVWPEEDGDATLARLRVVQARHALRAAQEYVERYHGDLDYPDAIRVRVRLTNDAAGQVRTFDVRVEFLAVATATRVAEGVAGA